VAIARKPIDGVAEGSQDRPAGKERSFAPDISAQHQTGIKLSELRPCRIALGEQDMGDAAPQGAASPALKPARNGGPGPAGLECHAASVANRFAAADLTLMRSLRSSNNLLVFREVAQGLCSAGDRLPVLLFTYKHGFPGCQQVFTEMPIFAHMRFVRTAVAAIAAG
jgi:hypothetical protein